MKTLARQSDLIQILSRLRALRPESPRRWGRMSAHQMVCHLADALRVATGEKPAQQAPSLLQRTLLRWFALHTPLRWPPGIRTTPDLDQELGGTRPAEFATDVARIVALLRQLTSQPRAAHQRLHPALGKLSEAEWLRWGYLHIDHHLRQFGA